MKILILNWRCIKNPSMGGSEIYFYELAKRWIKSGHEVTWFSPMFKNGLSEEKIDGIKFIREGGKYTGYIYSVFNYLKGSRDFDAIIDVENGIPFFSPLYIKNKKIFLHIHHIHKNVWFKQMPLPMALLGYVLETKIMPLIYKNKQIITLSKSSYDEIIKEKISKFEPKIVNPGIEFYKYKKIAKSKNPIILFLNRIKKYKGIDIFLEAANKLKEKNIEFWVVGDGDYLKNAKKYAQQNELKNLKFFGRVSEGEKIELMQKAWIFVNPSYKEGWGIVNIEANYFGTPVIGSNVAGIKDSVIDGKTGLLFKYGDYKLLAEKIELLINNKKKLKEISKEAKKWADEFDWDKKAEEYLNFLNTFY